MKNLAVAGSVALVAVVSLSAQDTRFSTPDTRPLQNDYNRASENYLTKANKASGLVGMDVRNPQNEKLGDIKDLVVDLPSGRIAYAVMSVGGFLGVGDKYIAVPPNELHLAADGRGLILNADKARLQSAPGFAKNNWPDINNPSWRTHSSYWQPGGTALGTPGSVRSGSETGGSLNDLGTFTGRIVAVDGAAKTITVESLTGKRTFRLANRSAITLRNESNARLENLRVSDQVTVRYHDQNGVEVADSVSDAQRIER